MGIKEQFLKIKDNWLILLLVLVLLFAMSGGNLISNITAGGYLMKGIAVPESAAVYQERAFYPIPSEDFAPDVEERQITKTSTLSTEVERGAFNDAETKLKNIITSSDSYLLNENVNKYGTKRKSYYYGSYQIKVDTEKYDSVISQLRDIGELKSFNENARDITARYTDTQTELKLAKEKLARFETMYAEAEEMKDKIDLNDRIFNQERTIKYLEDLLDNINKKIDYSTIYFTMTEKKSEYIDVVFVKFSELIRNLVASFNSLIKWIFVLLPWAVALLIIRFVWKKVKKK